MSFHVNFEGMNRLVEWGGEEGRGGRREGRRDEGSEMDSEGRRDRNALPPTVTHLKCHQPCHVGICRLLSGIGRGRSQPSVHHKLGHGWGKGGGGGMLGHTMSGNVPVYPPALPVSCCHASCPACPACPASKEPKMPVCSSHWRIYG